MKSRKGISLSITTMVVITVSLVVLIVVINYFVSGMGKTGGTVTEVATGADVDVGWSERVGRAVDIFAECKTGDDCDDGYECIEGECIEE